MKVHVLVDNTSIPGGPEGEHGLSLFIESGGNKILFDTGQGDRFAHNAEKMNVDLSKTHAVVISHGHYDHGGGIGHFLNINENAPIYVRKSAFESHLAFKHGSYTDIGINPDFKDNSRVIHTEGVAEITEGFRLFGEVGNEHPPPSGNDSLLTGTVDKNRPDDFLHEQNLLIEEGEKSVLVTGCSHCGIANIVKRAEEILGRFPDFVIGGFHLRISSEDSGDDSEINEISEILLQTGAMYYTGHCTNELAYEKMKETMNGKLEKMETGNVIEIRLQNRNGTNILKKTKENEE